MAKHIRRLAKSPPENTSCSGSRRTGCVTSVGRSSVGSKRSGRMLRSIIHSPPANNYNLKDSTRRMSSTIEKRGKVRISTRERQFSPELRHE